MRELIWVTEYADEEIKDPEDSYTSLHYRDSWWTKYEYSHTNYESLSSEAMAEFIDHWYENENYHWMVGFGMWTRKKLLEIDGEEIAKKYLWELIQTDIIATNWES